jgi:hypothetical protein
MLGIGIAGLSALLRRKPVHQGSVSTRLQNRSERQLRPPSILRNSDISNGSSL